jgi:hypothetical protein
MRCNKHPTAGKNATGRCRGCQANANTARNYRQPGRKI